MSKGQNGSDQVNFWNDPKELIKLAGLLVVLAGCYFAIKSNSEANTKAIDSIAGTVKSNRLGQDVINRDFEDRLRAHESELSSYKATARETQTDVRYIKESLDELRPLLMEMLRE